MKFSCKQQILSKALNIVSKAVTSRTTIPILKGILLKVDENGLLTMSASDLDLTIEKTFQVEDFQPGEIVVQAKLFGDIIRKLPNENILVENQDNNVMISCSNSQFNIVGSSSDEFPKLSLSEEEREKVVFDKEILKDMIKKTSFAASIDESRGVITGVLLEMTEESLNMVSLDGFRMAIARESIKNSIEKKVIIPAKIISEIAKIISESETEEKTVDMYINDKRVTFVIEDIKVVLRLLDGEFIKYNEILPSESKIKVIVNKSDLLESIERASLLAKVGKNNLVKFDIVENNIEITSKSEEGNVKENVIISKLGDDLVIGFNSKYIIDALKAIDDEEISLLFNNSVSPCLIRPINGNHYEYLVLPVRITNN